MGLLGRGTENDKKDDRHSWIGTEDCGEIRKGIFCRETAP